jgi:hypothetical protein
LEGGSTVPIDARQLVCTYADLTNPATWGFSPVCSSMALYNGMMTVVASGTCSGAYWLCDSVNYNQTCSWVKMGGGGAGTLTGATNGLSTILSGTTVVLGGTLSQTTTINGAGKIFCLGTNASRLCCIQMHVSGGTDITAIKGVYPNYCESGIYILPDQVQLFHSYPNSPSYYAELVNGAMAFRSTSGATTTSISFNGNGYIGVSSSFPNFSGMQYSGDYSDDYVCLSIPNAGWVTGYTQSAVTVNSNTMAVCNITVTSYTATTSNDFIGASGTCYIYLPSVPKPCQRITVADIAGTALGDNVTIYGNGKCINGCGCAIINTDYGSISFINNGYFWSAIAFIN